MNAATTEIRDQRSEVSARHPDADSNVVSGALLGERSDTPSPPLDAALSDQPSPDLTSYLRPLTSGQKWSIITSGAYTDPTSGLSIAYVDVVVDEEMYRISRGRRGWQTIRTPAMEMNDEMRSEAVLKLAAHCAKERRSEEMAAELHAHNAMPAHFLAGHRVKIINGAYAGCSGVIRSGDRYFLAIVPDQPGLEDRDPQGCIRVSTDHAVLPSLAALTVVEEGETEPEYKPNPRWCEKCQLGFGSMEQGELPCQFCGGKTVADGLDVQTRTFDERMGGFEIRHQLTMWLRGLGLDVAVRDDERSEEFLTRILDAGEKVGKSVIIDQNPRDRSVTISVRPMSFEPAP